NATASIGITTTFDTPYVHDNLAVRLSRTPPWLTASPRSGRILAGQETQLTLSFDALGLAGGDHDAQVQVLSNDPDESSVPLAVRLHVIGAPDLAVSPASVEFGPVFVNTVATRTV